MKEYYVVYVVNLRFEKGVFECDEIKKGNLKNSLDCIKNQIMTCNPCAIDASVIRILSWQEL